jgi:uncharacterized membrane protein
MSATTATDAAERPEARRPGARGPGAGWARPVPAGRGMGWLLLLAGAAGLAASVVLTLEKIRLLQDPHYVPSCNINPVISCGSVMATAQASAFGFPNTLIGIGGFAVVVTTGVAHLAGARLPRWYWLGLQAGLGFAICFVGWLIGQTLYRIGALCPYCMVVWTATIPLFWHTTVHNLRTRVIPWPAAWRTALDRAAGWAWTVPLLCYLAIATMILTRFWYYWSTLL